jgi:hypothetical protein
MCITQLSFFSGNAALVHKASSRNLQSMVYKPTTKQVDFEYKTEGLDCTSEVQTLVSGTK